MRIRFTAAVALVWAVFLVFGCGSRSVKEPPDTTRPAVVSTFPNGNATAVAVVTAVTVTFSETMDASSVNRTTFTLVNGASGTTVEGAVTCDAAGNAATFTPSSPLTHDTAYTARISTEAKDPAGNSLGSAFTWTFTTVPAPGALDKSFGSGGIVRTAVGSNNDGAMAVALQGDGKIVAAGYSTVVTAITPTTLTSTNYLTIVRYNPNGSIDTTFGQPLNSGRITDFEGTALSVAIQPDGKIVAAGTDGTGADFLIARYNGNGQTDAGFGAAGRAVIDMGGNLDAAAALALQSDGKIVVAGSRIVTSPTPTATNVAIARLNADGTLDASFSSTGKIITTSYDNSWATSVKIQPDGKILVSGHFQNAGGLMTPFITRYDQLGSPDTTFNSTGTVTLSPGRDAWLRGLEVLPDGKILAAGVIANATDKDIYLMRYSADGTPDTTFGQGGTGAVITNFNSGEEGAVAISVDSSEKILVAAQYHKTSGQPQTYDFAIFRYTADGTLDTSFGNGFGMVHSDFGGNLDDFAHSMLIQPDGKIVLAGYSWNGFNYDLGVCRYWP